MPVSVRPYTSGAKLPSDNFRPPGFIPTGATRITE
ncbi:MAG: hypothetical protein RLZZ326_760 [Planctomycetota bacterium]|jgi:hypothetical protein